MLAAIVIWLALAALITYGFAPSYEHGDVSPTWTRQVPAQTEVSK